MKFQSTFIDPNLKINKMELGHVGPVPEVEVAEEEAPGPYDMI